MPRTIRARWIPGCTPDTKSGKLDLDALGDFDPSPQTHVVVGVADADRSIETPDSTRSLVLGADTSVGRFRGVGAVPESGDITVSLWPSATACPLHAVTDGEYPQDLDGVGIGYSASASVVLIVGGSTSPTSPLPTSALVIDVASGTVEPVVGLPTPRIGPTVTPFGGKLLVAGGSDSDSAGKASANVFDPVLGRFEAGRIDLDRGRANHAAVVLASGETLVVGGSNSENNALRGLEIVSPETGTSTANGLDLEIGRANPVALRLTDDRILVAGGTGSDRKPVETLEWLSPDATSREPQSSSLAMAGTATAPVADRAFVAMPGGSALGVGGCELAQTSDCVACTTSAGSGCASKDVHWITRDGGVEWLRDALDAAAHPTLLVAGAEGRPWLIAGSSTGRRLLRFDPWKGRFTQPDENLLPPPLAGFEFEPGATAFESRIIGADPGLFLWLTGSDQNLPAIYGHRQGTRGPYDATVVPLLLANQDGVALDRKNEGKSGGLDPDTGYVVLKDGGPALVVTDTTYANVDLSITLGDPTPPSDLPIVVLFASEARAVDGRRTYGDLACPWPSPPAGKPLAPRLRRIGATVTLTQGDTETTCAGPPGRVSISLRSPGGDVSIRSIDVKRSL